MIITITMRLNRDEKPPPFAAAAVKASDRNQPLS